MAWHKFLAAGLVGSVAIVGCTVTTDSSVGTDGGDGGSTASGGSSSGGGGASSGGASTGGKSASGGTGSGGKAGGGAGGAADTDAGPPGECTKCLMAKCGPEYADCKTDNVCLKQDEFQSIQECMFKIKFGDSGAGIFTAADLAQCAGDNAVDTTIDDTTDALIRCLHGAEDASTQPCTTECFGDTVPF